VIADDKPVPGAASALFRSLRDFAADAFSRLLEIGLREDRGSGHRFSHPLCLHRLTGSSLDRLSKAKSGGNDGNYDSRQGATLYLMS
jgi:hypothetical protein